MRRRRELGAAVAVMIAVTAGACTPAPAPSALTPRPGPADLRVVTYNLLGAQADDRGFDEHRGWAARVDQLRPDVLVVQEAQADDVGALLARTATPYRLAAYQQWECDRKPWPEGVAILVREPLVVSGSGRTHVGDSCTDPSVRRVLVWATVDTPEGPVTVYGTHLTAGGGAAAGSRDTQIRRIRRLVAEADAAAGGTGRWLLAGDVNAAPGGSSHGLLMSGEPDDGLGPLLDTAAEASPAAGDPGTCPVVEDDDAAATAALWTDPEHVRSCGYTAGWPKDDNPIACDLLSICTSWEARRESSVRERIDVVLRSPSSPFTVVDAFVPSRLDDDWSAVGAEWFHLSDHLPAVVDLDVVATGGAS